MANFTLARRTAMHRHDGAPTNDDGDRDTLGAVGRTHLRERLERERERLARRLERYGSDLATHRQRVAQRDPCAILSPAAATEDAEQEVRSRMAAEAESDLAAVDWALRRLEEAPDQFGLCARCGGAISAARLELLPATTLCERCAAGNA
jgi:RNA polymerase-binding transcription factor DksA